MRRLFSQTRDVEHRKAAGLPPVDEMKRFRILVCCMFCSICTSIIYAFDLFTTDFSDRFHLSAGDQSTISTVGLVFCYFTLPYGFLFDYAGPFPLLVLSALTGGFGALFLGLTFDGEISGNVVNISVFYALLNTCSGLADTAAIVTLAETFPRNRGPVIALAKVMTSLGSSVLASLSVNIFNNISAFIYFLMVFSVVVSSVAAFVMVLPPYFINGWRRRGKTDEQLAVLTALQPAYHHKFVPVRRLALGYVIAGALLVFFTVVSPVVSYTEVSHKSSIAIGIITIALVLCFFSMILPIQWLGGMDERSDDANGDFSAGEIDLKQLGASGDEVSNTVGNTTTTTQPDNELTFLGDEMTGVRVDDVDPELPQDPRYGGTVWDNLKKPDIWFLLITFVCQSGLGVIVMYNASTISVAITGEERSQGTSALYTAFLGVGSSLGRIGMGMFEAYVQHQPPDNRRFLVTLALPLSPLIAVIAGILLLTLPGKLILLPYILVYFEEGVFAAVSALIFPCLYEGNHGVYYNIGFLTTVVSVIGFNRLLFGLTVDSKHDSLGFGPNEECNVAECVRLPIIVATAVAAVATLLSFIVHIRYSRFVKRERSKGALSAGASVSFD
ncbi:uncharacterized protein TM35_000371520 [Trypanosoma theileri]|uniref:Nodulin-like domain-containing protein n=1 Tax=Trypanosoma theileri TaxID=67003 RepID=A0A1X0NM09_9TRYP|nr:uncharacterized protein TM35_000371520 [Trypanosoma theileri]ORC85179.1 hypothetical protein TM35_000371520 [Trypanosoma theileri]